MGVHCNGLVRLARLLVLLQRVHKRQIKLFFPGTRVGGCTLGMHTPELGIGVHCNGLVRTRVGSYLNSKGSVPHWHGYTGTGTPGTWVPGYPSEPSDVHTRVPGCQPVVAVARYGRKALQENAGKVLPVYWLPARRIIGYPGLL
eukprot:1120323-Rhodomonas_salina.1